MEQGEIFYLKETDEGVVVKRLEIRGYRIPQLDRIEEKLDKLHDLLGDKELEVKTNGKTVSDNLYLRSSDSGEIRITKTENGK